MEGTLPTQAAEAQARELAHGLHRDERFRLTEEFGQVSKLRHLSRKGKEWQIDQAHYPEHFVVDNKQPKVTYLKKKVACG